MFFCFKQLLFNIRQKFESQYHLIDGERLLSLVVGEISFLVDIPLDLHDTTFLVFLGLFKL